MQKYKTEIMFIWNHPMSEKYGIPFSKHQGKHDCEEIATKVPGRVAGM